MSMLGFVPMPHTAKLLKADSALDEWGLPMDTGVGESIPCKITYNSSNESIQVASGEMVVYSAAILFEGAPKIRYEDLIEWSDDWGNVHKKPPLNINYKHDLAGSPVAVKVTV
ncbi:hypothetical protein [Bacillus atrophaeus]|uniref:Uncharacterized protein n=1 Tax=Bacillus atrophaeus (strain 1942) TaxID=720555 RepID=A0ABM5LYF1_BACA1|nr:hypothetical protein [Bacillus atrophaeus]AMR62310.1 hypothetical protein A1D11_07775 [Bacillus subtilis subsp. globigii]ADP32900.1 hypothetical protein BATR1942_09835 [Bacillus atrophaeus 1942]AIK47790.1 hypothetical protein DJ95_1854 [Bacillus atrophaeus subsp. globigii]ASS71702.1 hypothetical protein BaGK_12405 [Bacillus atrophaeus]EIM12313.1 hypothetical protein UY9_03516 [Bacillus atrophaeus C89]